MCFQYNSVYFIISQWINVTICIQTHKQNGMIKRTVLICSTKILLSIITSNPELKKKYRSCRYKTWIPSYPMTSHTQSRNLMSDEFCSWCMIPFFGTWFSLSILICSLLPTRSHRNDRPAGETVPSRAVSPTIATNKWNLFCSVFFFFTDT